MYEKSADIGWQVENYGTAPDIDVDMRPPDHTTERDPQLERAHAEIQQLLATQPPALPEFSERPRLPVPMEETQDEEQET